MTRKSYQRIVRILLVTLLLCLLVTQTAAAQDDTGTVIHVVQWGETLYKIAKQYGVSQANIMAANSLASADRIYAGQQLIIPGADYEYPSGGIYVVVRGDTLFKISVKYGVSMQSIIAANNIINPSRIEVGQQLVIPGVDTGTTTEYTGTGGPDTGETAPAETSGEPISHIVQGGETLSQIASRYGYTTWELAQANSISNPSLIYVGQVILITRVPASESMGSTDTQPAAQPSTGGGTYTVQPGDYLDKIAETYQVAIVDLINANGIANPNVISVGQVLTIPPIPPAPAATITSGKQIVVDLSLQRTYAYENGVLQRQFVVSTGLPATPTVQGNFTIISKVLSQRMSGPGYDLPNVPYVMYFYSEYSFHGTYWHNRFGQPMSHGCVNMRTDEAQWLYNWAPLGTPVLVIP
ncbi:MAG: LysM peptidoglycan-binding domain-containing protein [Anaerolineae bacterium]|nr:LysM peptidoglycan-binding domain-containing protein [Anaerolineae bacterium]